MKPASCRRHCLEILAPDEKTQVAVYHDEGCPNHKKDTRWKTLPKKAG